MQPALEELVRSATRRDADAFAQLISRFERSALALAYSLTGQADLSGEIVQEAFLRAWERLNSLKHPERFGAWLMEIVRNLTADAHRRRRPTGAALDAEQPDPNCISPPDSLDRQEDSRQLREALKELDPISRSAVVLRYYDGRSSREIGQLLNLSPAAVDMRLNRARQFLRERLAIQLEYKS